MEEDKLSQINKFLSELVEHTLCKAPFLEFFAQKEILDFAEIDSIKAKHQETEQASEFYRLIKSRANSYPILLDGLKRTDQGDIVSILEDGIIPPTLNVRSRVAKRLYNNENSRGAPMDNLDPIHHSNTAFDVSEPVDIFTGRRKEIENLHKMVLRSGASGKPTVISQVTSISGLGGIGKTQLARQYINQYASHFDGNCIWLEGETERNLSTGFRTLAKDKLGITTHDANGADKDIKSVVADVYKYFSKSKCLFVFDNVEKCAWLQQYLPNSSNFCPHIVFTSRDREWEKDIGVIELLEMGQNDARQMVKRGLGLETDCSQDEMILDLVRMVQCFPLALHQAISYILDQQERDDYSVATYLTNFERQKQELLSFGVNFKLVNDYAMTTYTTWKITIERIGKDEKHGEFALQILYSMAFLYPEKIHRELFLHHPNIKAGNTDDAIDKVKLAVRLLVKFSMVRGENKQRILSIHRLVQEVMKVEWIEENMGSQVLGNAMKMIIDDEEIHLSENVVHLQVALFHTWKYPDLNPSRVSGIIFPKYFIEWYYNKFIQGIMLVHKDEQFFEFIQMTLLATLRFCRKEEFLEVQEKLLSGLEEFIDKNDEHALKILNTWGLLVIERGMFEISLMIFQKVCPEKNDCLKRPIFGTYLAMSLLNLGRAQEALDMLRNIYENLKFAARSKRSTLILVSCNLALCMNEVKDYEGSLKILLENYGRDDILTKEERKNTCNLILIIGTVQRNRGNYDEAMEKHLDAYQKFVNIYEEDNFYPQICRTEYAEDLICAGRLDEAVNILEVTLPKLETLAPKHYILLEKKVLFAKVLGKQEKDLRRAHAILENVMETIVKRDWTKVAYFEKISKEITKIQNALGDNAKE